MSVVDATSQVLARHFAQFASGAIYQRDGIGYPVRAFARGLRGDELVAAAQQYDHFVQLEAAKLAYLGLMPPRRFDRIIVGGRTLVVEDWRPATASGTPAFVKLMAKGGG